MKRITPQVEHILHVCICNFRKARYVQEPKGALPLLPWQHIAHSAGRLGLPAWAAGSTAQEAQQQRVTPPPTQHKARSWVAQPRRQYGVAIRSGNPAMYAYSHLRVNDRNGRLAPKNPDPFDAALPRKKDEIRLWFIHLLQLT